jgi:hypothetical protein
LHRFRTIKLLQEVLSNVGRRSFISAFVTFDSIKNCGYTYDEVVSTCTDHLIDRGEYLGNRENVLGNGMDENMQDRVGVNEFEQRLIDEALHRSEESAAEDMQLREALARSVEN